VKRPRDLFGNPIKGPREDAIQEAIVQLLRLAADRRTIYLAIPNGIPASARIGARFVKAGLLAGAPDLLIITPDGRTNFLEVKAPDGRQSDAQKDFQARCAVLGLRYRVVRSIGEAEETLREWKALRGPIANSCKPAADSWERSVA
jgi:hypothetical protein